MWPVLAHVLHEHEHEHEHGQQPQPQHEHEHEQQPQPEHRVHHLGVAMGGSPFGDLSAYHMDDDRQGLIHIDVTVIAARGLAAMDTMSINRCTVIAAQGLAAMDAMSINSHSGTADPFVILHRGDQSQQTTVQRNTLEPTWNETFRFEISPEIDLGNPMSIGVSSAAQRGGAHADADAENTGTIHIVYHFRLFLNGLTMGLQWLFLSIVCPSICLIISCEIAGHDQRLVAVLYDWDRLGYNAIMGQVILPLDMPMNEPQWFQLQPMDGSSYRCVSILFSYCFHTVFVLRMMNLTAVRSARRLRERSYWPVTSFQRR